MPRLPDLLTRSRGDRAADAMLRATGALGLVATVGTLISPVVATFVPFMMFTIWTNGPHSPVLPASHEPILMLYGRLYPPLLVGALGTAGIVFAEWINYRLYREASNHRAFAAVRDNRTVQWLTRLFGRSPFLAVVVAAVTPVPYWIARILSVHSRYPVRRHLAATAIGRFPRLTFFAALGGPLGIPVKWLAAVTVVSILIGAGLAAAGIVRRRARVLTSTTRSTPMHPATAVPVAVIALGILVASARAAAETGPDSTTLAIPIAPAETLSVQVAGEGSPVVFIPGLFGSAFAFRSIAPAMAALGHRTVIVEPLGIGRSSRPRRADYSLAAQAARIAVVLDSLGIGGGVVVAHSLGGAMAYRLALQRPDLVRGIVSIEGGPAESATTSGFRVAMRFAPVLRLIGGRNVITSQTVRNLRQSSGDPGWVTEETVQGYTADAARDLGATLDAFRGMAEAREPWRLTERLPEITIPVYLLVGGAEHDGGIDPSEVAALRATLPRLTIETVTGAGHFIFEEQPAVVIATIQRAAATALVTASSESPAP